MRRARIMFFLIACLALASSSSAEQRETNTLWDDGEPEVVLGAYFDAAGTDTVFKGELPDTLAVTIMMWNGGLRNEGPVIALEYSVELPTGMSLVSEELPEHTNMAMGTAVDGISQAGFSETGDGLIINSLILTHDGTVPSDTRIRILPHPKSGKLSYVHRWGDGIVDVDNRLMVPQDAIINPVLSETQFKPVRSEDNPK